MFCEARLQGQSLILLLKDNAAGQMLTSSTRVLNSFLKIEGQCFHGTTPLPHGAHVSHAWWFHNASFPWFTVSCHGRLPRCHVSVKSWLTRPRVPWQGPEVSLCKTLAGPGELLDSQAIPIWGLGGEGGGRRGHAEWMPEWTWVWGHKKALTVQALGSLQYVTALYPPLQFYFPVASICQKGFCACQDFPS